MIMVDPAFQNRMKLFRYVAGTEVGLSFFERACPKVKSGKLPEEHPKPPPPEQYPKPPPPEQYPKPKPGEEYPKPKSGEEYPKPPKPE